jgi:hypothetical protein
MEGMPRVEIQPEKYVLSGPEGSVSWIGGISERQDTATLCLWYLRCVAVKH